MVQHFTNEGYQMILVIGGGKTARMYQATGRLFNNMTHNDLDWLGIESIRLNCDLEEILIKA